jgi:DhnA family fructose-bisphosphate aldolase class Ia
MGYRKPRMNRLFAASGRCFDVAIDHGFFNEGAFLSGIEDIDRAVRTIAAAGPDAIQLTVGQARVLQDLPGPRKPQLVLRTDVANVYNPELHEVLWSRMIEDPVEQALELDAACVVVNLLLLPGQPDLHGQCVENICRLRPKCERFGMPLMIEPLVMQENSRAGGYMVDGDLRKILPLVRQARELGADVIKADPCDDVSQYHQVVKAAASPILVRGGGRAPTREILQRTADLMKQGAAGIVYGRNVVQHPDPAGITRAFMAVVHEGASVDQALAKVKE